MNQQTRLQEQAELEIAKMMQLNPGRLWDASIIKKISDEVEKYREGGHDLMTDDRHNSLKAIEPLLKSLKGFEGLADVEISELARNEIADSHRSFSRTSFGIHHDLLMAFARRHPMEDKALASLIWTERIGKELVNLNASLRNYELMLEKHPELESIRSSEEHVQFIVTLAGKIKSKIGAPKPVPAEVVQRALGIAKVIQRNNMSEGSINIMLSELYRNPFFSDYTDQDRETLRNELGGDIQLTLDAEFALAQQARRHHPELAGLVELWQTVVYVR